MSVYVGIDVHRERSRVAVVTEDGQVQLNKNVVNGSEPFLRLIGDLPPGDAGGVRGRVRLGMAGPDCWRTTGSTRTWCIRCGARRSPRRGVKNDKGRRGDPGAAARLAAFRHRCAAVSPQVAAG